MCDNQETKIHLKFDMMTAGIECNENRHPQVVMRELGISYQHATIQSIGDQWWFWACKSIPAGLPKYLKPMTFTGDMECK